MNEEQVGEWQLFPATPQIDGYYDVRPNGGDDGSWQARWNWALGHWYDQQGRIRREAVDFRGSAVPLHAASCATNLPEGAPGSRECDCFLSKFNA